MALLAMTFYAGQYAGDMGGLMHICDIDGNVTRDGEEPITTLEEARITLDMCTKRYDTPALEGSALTVFIRRKGRGRTTPLARLDVLLQDGHARSTLNFSDNQRLTFEPIPVLSDGASTYDGVGIIVREIFAAHLRRG